jgi:hypothetical protein
MSNTRVTQQINGNVVLMQMVICFVGVKTAFIVDEE